MTHFKQTFEVQPSAIDENGHVNNLETIRWMLDAARLHADSSGSTAATDADGGVWFVRSHSIQYLAQTVEGDVIEMHTWVDEIRRASSRRKYELTRLGDGVIVARGETEWAYVDPTTGRPKGIPPQMREAFGLDARG